MEGLINLFPMLSKCPICDKHTSQDVNHGRITCNNCGMDITDKMK